MRKTQILPLYIPKSKKETRQRILSGSKYICDGEMWLL